MKKLVFTILIAVFVALTMRSEQWIRVNQLGYLPVSTKVAVWMSNEASTVQNFELIDAYTGQVAYRGTSVRVTRPLQYMKSTCRLDFSDFTRVGAYRIRVGETSAVLAFETDSVRKSHLTNLLPAYLHHTFADVDARNMDVVQQLTGLYGEVARARRYV